MLNYNLFVLKYIVFSNSYVIPIFVYKKLVLTRLLHFIFVFAAAYLVRQQVGA